MRKTIKTEFFTTLSFWHFIRSLYLVTIWRYKILNWKYIKVLEDEILNYLEIKKSKIISFYSARTWIYQLLLNWDFKNKKEVIVSWYNCVSVINSIIQAWYKPIYCDINKNDLWLNIDDLKSKINNNTALVIIQHSFWKTAKIEEIISICKENKVLTLEDCAHSLWTKYKNKNTWTFADFSIFSTWRDKVISWVNWGFLVINNESYNYLEQKIKSKLTNINKKEVIKNINYNILWYLSLLSYDFLWLWKIIIYYSRKFFFINEIITENEKNCVENNLNYKLPNALAYLAYNDLRKIHIYNLKRRYISNTYNKKINNLNIEALLNDSELEEQNYFRYPVFIKNNLISDFVKYFRDNGVIIWTSWSWINIAPITTNIKKCNYNNDCKNSNIISKNIVFLPNHKFMTDNDIDKIIKLTNNFNNV